MQAKKKELGIISLEDWPPSSPNFNVIENIWHLLKQRLKSRGAILSLEARVTSGVGKGLRGNSMPHCHNAKTHDGSLEAYEKNGLATKF